MLLRTVCTNARLCFLLCCVALLGSLVADEVQRVSTDELGWLCAELETLIADRWGQLQVQNSIVFR